MRPPRGKRKTNRVSVLCFLMILLVGLLFLLLGFFPSTLNHITAYYHAYASRLSAVALLPSSSSSLHLASPPAVDPHRLLHHHPHLAPAPTVLATIERRSELDVIDPDFGRDLERLQGVPHEDDNEDDWLYMRKNGTLIKVPVSQLAPLFKDLEPSPHRLLLTFPFFNGTAERWPEVAVTLPYYQRYLNLFKINYTAVLVEQMPGKLFNRGTLFNIAYDQFKGEYDYIALMDVDSLPVFNMNGSLKWVPFDWPPQAGPWHIGREVEKNGWRLHYRMYTGTGLLTRMEDYLAHNGYSNNYYGWGLEDDDLAVRIRETFTQINRYTDGHGMFMSMPHVINLMCHTNNRGRNKFIQENGSGERWKIDGLSSLKYTIFRRAFTPIWGGFYWLKTEPKSPLFGGQITSLPQEEIDACWERAALKATDPEAKRALEEEMRRVADERRRFEEEKRLAEERSKPLQDQVTQRR